MKSTWSRSLSCCSSLVALMVAAGCAVETDKEAPIVGTAAETSEASAFPAEATTTAHVPNFDDLLGPAVDENDPASEDARAMYELVGPQPNAGVHSGDGLSEAPSPR